MPSRRSLFDRWSETYDGVGLQLVTYRPVHDAVLGRLADVDPAVVVDLGCGTGQLTARLRDRFPESAVVGIDLSAGMICRASERVTTPAARRAGLLRADAHRLPLSPAAVDVIVCTESFHWYRDQPGVLRELATALRPGGRLLIASIAAVTELGALVVRRTTAAGGNEVTALPPRRLRTLLADAGFDVTAQRRVPRFGPVAWPVLTEARLPSADAAGQGRRLTVVPA